MNGKQNLGQFGEEVAVEYLIKNGYKIIERNYRCKLGEIDIIAKKYDLLIFVEVKTRRNNNFGYPVESITKEKQRHIYNTVYYYLITHKIAYNEVRIDAIEVYVEFGNTRINHIPDIIFNKG